MAIANNNVVWSASLFLLALASVQGCSGNFPDDPAVSIEHRSIVEREGIVRVGICPILRREESKRYFGGDILSKGILPIHIVVENKGKTSLVVDRENIRVSGLNEYNGNPMKDKSDAGEIKNYVGMTALAAGSVAAAPAVVVGGMLVSEAQMVKKNVKKYRLDRHTVSPGTEKSGFVYFQYSGKERDDMILSVVLSELGSDKKYEVSLPFE